MLSKPLALTLKLNGKITSQGVYSQRSNCSFEIKLNIRYQLCIFLQFINIYLEIWNRLRESSRDELFEKAKGEILDEVVNLSQISAKDWEQLLYKKLWDKLSNYCFENIYLAAANASSPGKTKINLNILLSNISDLIFNFRTI